MLKPSAVAPVAERRPAAPLQSAGGAGALVRLQRSAGNRAVGKVLARQPRLATRKPSPATVKFTVVPPHRMDKDEFTIFVYAQVLGVGPDEAASLLQALEHERGGLRRQGHFLTGISDDEAGKPMPVAIELPPQEPAEVESRQERAELFAALPEQERRRINAEADRRFWQKLGDRSHGKLGQRSNDLGERELWLRTRDDVIHDRELIQDLPDAARRFLMPGDRELDPVQYQAALRIAHKVSTFADADWARYQRRAGAKTDDYALIEWSIDKFIAEQQAEQNVIDRIKGTEKLFEARRSGRKEFGVRVDEALLPSRFHSLEDYDAACADYLKLFRNRAQEIALVMLRASETVVRAELERYEKPGEVANFYSELAKLRDIAAGKLDPKPDLDDDRDEQVDEGPSPETTRRFWAGEAERKTLSEQHPILKDPKLWTSSLTAAATPDQLGKVLRDDARDRLHDIETVRSRVIHSPETVFQLDRVLELTADELKATKGTIGGLIVEAHLKDIAADNLLKAVAVAILAIGLGLLTFGTGTVAVVAATAELGVGIYSAAEEWDKFNKASEAAHTAFDPKDAVSGDEPTALWLAMSLIAVGFDGAALAGAMKAAAPAAKVLGETGSAARFEAAIAKATELSEGVRNSLAKAAEAEEKFLAAAQDLSAYSAGRMSSQGVLDPKYLAKVKRVAYYAAAEKIRDFQVFLAKLKVQKFSQALKLEGLAPAELEAIETAFNQGLKEFDTAAPALTIDVPYASGPSKLTIGPNGELILDGKIVGAKAATEEVFHKLGLAHAYRGHGANRDLLTIANEAVLNAARPGRAGLSSRFASNEAMLRSFEIAKAEVAAGKGVRSGAYVKVDVPTTPDVGRVFVAKSKLPAGVTPINPQPFDSLPEVAELMATHVRALFTETKPGVFEIADLFPAFVP